TAPLAPLVSKLSRTLRRATRVGTGLARSGTHTTQPPASPTKGVTPMPPDVLLKVEGVEGESSDAKHKNEIEVLSFSWGVSQAITGNVSSSETFYGQRCDMSPL